jgi:hypothetical protein
MRPFRSVVGGALAVAAALWLSLVVSGQVGQLPLEPLGRKGEALFPYLEGWYENQDGTFSILFGYFNRNSAQTFEIPVGPNNKFEPTPEDRGQPTIFHPNRNNRMFTVVVPKSFGTSGKITWTLTANGITQSATAWLDPEYFVEPLINSGTGNTPPMLKIGESAQHMGPPRGFLATFDAAVGQPLTLSAWVADKGNTIVLDPNPQRAPAGRGRGGRGGGDADGRGRGRGGEPAPAARIHWETFRGPGAVKFAQEVLPIKNAAGETVETTATFAQPGAYWLRVMATEGGGEAGSGQCCSTSAIVRVNVK